MSATVNRLHGSFALLCVAILLLAGVIFVGWSTGEHAGLCDANTVVGDAPHTAVSLNNGDDQPHRVELVVETDQGKSRSTHCLDPGEGRTVELPYRDDDQATLTLNASLYWSGSQQGITTSEDSYNSVRIDAEATIHLSSGTP